MESRSTNDQDRRTVRYRIVVRGELRPPLVGPLENLVVESAGDETALLVDIVDQSHLQGVINSLSDRGIDIVSLGIDPAPRPRGAGRPERGEGWPI